MDLIKQSKSDRIIEVLLNLYETFSFFYKKKIHIKNHGECNFKRDSDLVRKRMAFLKATKKKI